VGYSGGALGAAGAADAASVESTAPEWASAAPAVAAGGGCEMGRLASLLLGWDCLREWLRRSDRSLVEGVQALS